MRSANLCFAAKEGERHRQSDREREERENVSTGYQRLGLEDPQRIPIDRNEFLVAAATCLRPRVPSRRTNASQSSARARVPTNIESVANSPRHGNPHKGERRGWRSEELEGVQAHLSHHRTSRSTESAPRAGHWSRRNALGDARCNGTSLSGAIRWHR